eukprot:IDg5372t1
MLIGVHDVHHVNALSEHSHLCDPILRGSLVLRSDTRSQIYTLTKETTAIARQIWVLAKISFSWLYCTVHGCALLKCRGRVMMSAPPTNPQSCRTGRGSVWRQSKGSLVAQTCFLRATMHCTSIKPCRLASGTPP